MLRDERFEIQYLISLLIAVLGAITAGGIGDFIDIWVALAFLTLVFLHLVMFNIYYTFSTATSFEIDAVDRLQEVLRWTLVLISVAFLFFVFHMAGLVGMDLFTECEPGISVVLADITDMSSCSQSKIVISYAAPVLIVGVLGIGVGANMMSSINLFKNIDFTIAPASLRVFYTFEETEPVLVNVANHTSESQSFRVEIDLPDDVVAEYNEHKVTDQIEESITVDAKRKEKLHLQLKYHGGERRRDEIPFRLVHEKGERDETMDVLLVD